MQHAAFVAKKRSEPICFACEIPVTEEAALLPTIVFLLLSAVLSPSFACNILVSMNGMAWRLGLLGAIGSAACRQTTGIDG